MKQIIEKFRAWKLKHPDEDYQLDEIQEFVSSLDRGELLEVFEALESKGVEDDN
jgi:hypothetical protein